MTRATYPRFCEVASQRPRVVKTLWCPVYVNPTVTMLKALYEAAAKNQQTGLYPEPTPQILARYVRYDGDVFMWDAYEASHDQVCASLGVPELYANTVTRHGDVRQKTARAAGFDIRRLFPDTPVAEVAAAVPTKAALLKDGYALADYLHRITHHPAYAVEDVDGKVHRVLIAYKGKAYDARGEAGLVADASRVDGELVGALRPMKLPARYAKFTDAQLAAYVKKVPALRSLTTLGWG